MSPIFTPFLMLAVIALCFLTAYKIKGKDKR